jgi:hypothetical protein
MADFDVVLRAPNHIAHLNPDFNSRDHLYLNIKAYYVMAYYVMAYYVMAYYVMARAFPLRIFEQFAIGVQNFV